MVSILVPLLPRSAISPPAWSQRLARLDYPRDRLDVLLVVEERRSHDPRELWRDTPLPPWMRIVIVPRGAVKTKPRALNHALDFCRGSIIGVYDAEDAPEPDQIRHGRQRVPRARRPRSPACRACSISTTRARTGSSRCFTIEYADWFRVVLPGVARLGLPVPLGGTTLFFRRDALEGSGRLGRAQRHRGRRPRHPPARHGYRDRSDRHASREEEANCRALPWVRQRSRWIKGYMMTWRVHMRDPRSLLARPGAAEASLGFQVLFLGTLVPTC